LINLISSPRKTGNSSAIANPLECNDRRIAGNLDDDVIEQDLVHRAPGGAEIAIIADYAGFDRPFSSHEMIPGMREIDLHDPLVRLGQDISDI
jgi:hypothetical protein